MLFLFKVALKWGLIFYAWAKAKAMGEENEKKEDEKDIEVKDN